MRPESSPPATSHIVLSRDQPGAVRCLTVTITYILADFSERAGFALDAILHTLRVLPHTPSSLLCTRAPLRLPWKTLTARHWCVRRCRTSRSKRHRVAGNQ